MQKITEIKFKKSDTVLVRASLNVPIKKDKNGKEKIENDFRLKSILKTLKYLSKKKIKIILIGHIGKDEKSDLGLVFSYLKKQLKKEKINIFFDEKTFLNFDKNKKNNILNKIEDLKNGEILLLDNLRQSKEEKKNSKKLASDLKSFSDFYVNEAFAVSHRKHCSVSALPEKFEENKKAFGFRFWDELKNVEKIKNHKSPSILFLGGAKIETKLPMVKNLINKFDLIVVGGGIANTFLKQKGFEIGKSICDEKNINLKQFLENKKVFVPEIVETENGVKHVSEVGKNEKILDNNPKSYKEVEEIFKKAKFVFYNGPFGFYEGGYKKGSVYILKKFANKKQYFVIGGGNTVSVAQKLKLEDDINFVSTGGGALLYHLSK